MTLTLLQYLLGGGSGLLVGLTLGLFGGGGSILAVPLMVYVVGVPNAHMAIGTSALAVAVNAAAGLVSHARHGSVKWKCAAVFASAGIAGAFGGSTLGKAINGQALLFFFALLMVLVGFMMVRKRSFIGDPTVILGRGNAGKLAGFGGATGVLSGFFGIGGGFLIVPGLMAATKMPILFAVGTSLVAVTAFGLTTAFNYALSGYVDWPLAFVFIGGGLLGGIAGEFAARRLSTRGGSLNVGFALLIFAVAIYMAVRSASAFI